MSLTGLISEYLTYLPSITGHKAVFSRCLGQERTKLIACIRFYIPGKSFILKWSVYFALLYCQMSDGPSIIICAELNCIYFNSHVVFPLSLAHNFSIISTFYSSAATCHRVFP